METSEKMQKYYEAAMRRDGMVHVASTNFLALKQEVTQLEADKARLDYLQEQTKGYGKGWILRGSQHGRGMRLHETSQEGAKPTVREAIDAAKCLSDRAII